MQTFEEKLSCDIVVVGSGVSGLCAAVQAAEEGKKIIMLESCKRAGGNWNVTYGMMAVDSPISREQGIEVDVKALVNQEIKIFNYQVDHKLWMDLVNRSGSNVEWLMERGVEFNRPLEPYTAGDIYAPVFHTWVPGSKPSNKMLATYEKVGGIVLTETKGKSLLLEDGSVVGLIAEKANGNLIHIECEVVISAGGGFTDNADMVSRVIGRKDYATRGIGNCDGSAINMCIDAGAKSLLGHETILSDLIPRYMKSVKHWLNYIHNRPGSYPFHINVNQDSERYVDESCTLKLFPFSPAASFTQEQTFRIYDDEKLKKLDGYNDMGIYDIIKEYADHGEAGIFRADTIEELASKLGLDPESLAETIDTYNIYCEAGEDPVFEKNAEFLQTFKPPFYGWENGYQVPMTMQGVDYNIKMEALSDHRKVIPGLYIAGTDGSKLWRNFYSLSIPGSCNSNNVNSGRLAGINAVEYIG